MRGSVDHGRRRVNHQTAHDLPNRRLVGTRCLSTAPESGSKLATAETGPPRSAAKSTYRVEARTAVMVAMAELFTCGPDQTSTAFSLFNSRPGSRPSPAVLAEASNDTERTARTCSSTCRSAPWFGTTRRARFWRI